MLEEQNSVTQENTVVAENLKDLADPKSVVPFYADAEVQFNYEVPVRDHLCGAHIAGKKLYLIQGNKPQSLNWEGYGFRMHFSQDTLPPEDSCEVVVHALVGGNFKFPEGNLSMQFT